jgi:hypothetical protein
MVSYQKQKSELDTAMVLALSEASQPVTPAQPDSMIRTVSSHFYYLRWNDWRVHLTCTPLLFVVSTAHRI